MPPGLTGLWQVSGRNTLTMKQGLDLDIEYVGRQSLAFDLWILARTIPVVLSTRGALMTRGRHGSPTRGLSMADEPALPNSPARWRFTRALPRQAPPPGGGAPTPAQGAAAAEQGAAAAADSITVATWTIVSRVTGVAKFACIGAVLGPTFFGNTYQFTNSLPNLIYYGFLAGSLFSSLLVPALVRHIDAGDHAASRRVAGGFLGMTLVALVVIAPVAIVLGPLVLRFAAMSGTPAMAAAQESAGRLLIIMFVPQIFCYGVVGTATAVMNSRQRFALAAGAPAVENLGTIAVLLLTAVIYGTGTGLSRCPAGELLLLGLGSTAAVAVHAAVQWWGARRAGVLLAPGPAGAIRRSAWWSGGRCRRWRRRGCWHCRC